MVMCFAPDCKHYSEKHGCRFSVFPKEEKEKKIWLKLLRREDREPSKYSLVCSCHFVNANRRNRPTIYERNQDKIFKVSPEKKAKVQVHNQTSGQNLLHYNLDHLAQLAKNMRTLKLEEENKKRFTAMTEAENYFLNEQVNQLTANLNHLPVCFSWDHIKNNDKRILMYTGLPNKEIFVSVFNLMQNFELKYYYGWSVIGLSKIYQFLMTLMKLRLNLHHEDLACRFNISRTTVSNVILTWIHALHEVIFEQLMDEITSRQKNKLYAPTAFNSFTNCRIIIDCTEISTVSPKNMDTQQLTYSSYKHRNTLKRLVGVAPNGVCTFISKLYPGSISDKKNFAHCGLRDRLVPGDLVLADKGFLIVDLLPDGVTLNIPPFLTTPQFTPEQVNETHRIARARIHVERAIQRIKCFDILNKIPRKLIPQSSHIFQVCGALSNFKYPLIKKVEDLFCRNAF